MGCFLACFGGAKDKDRKRRRRRPAKRPLPVDDHRAKAIYKPLLSTPSPKRLPAEVAPSPIRLDGALIELRENEEKESSSGGRRKRVTFDLNVTTYEDVVADDEESKRSSDDEEEKETTGEERKGKEGEGKISPALYPSNHRYQNCSSSDDEDDFGSDGEDEDEEEYEDCDIDEDDVEEVGIDGKEEESYDSYFSLPMDKVKQNFQEVTSPQPVGAASPDGEPTISAKGNARDRSQYVHSVLNPVENLSKWKEVKVRAVPLKNPSKENINSELETKLGLSPEPVFRFNKPQNPIDSTPSPHSRTKQEVSVDASLSNWLVSSENSKEGQQESSPLRSNSSLSHEDRPILGALTVEDLKQSSVTSSPRRSPSRSPDDIPILGTVGSYWSTKAQVSDTKGIPNTTSKYREDKRVNWHSTPFDVRLERALNKGAVEACSSY